MITLTNGWLKMDKLKTVSQFFEPTLKHCLEIEEDTCKSCKYVTPCTVNGGVCGQFRAWFCLYDAIVDGYNNVEQVEPMDTRCECYECR